MGSSNHWTEPGRCLVLFFCLLAGVAHAQGPARLRVTVGPPHRSVEVHVDGNTLVVGASRTPFPLGRAPTRTPVVENVTVAGKKLAIVRYREGDAIVEALIGAAGLVHLGRADLHGDPGERTRQALVVEGASIIRRDEDERMRLCDGTRLVRVRAFDAANSRFVPVARTGEPVGDVLATVTEGGPERTLAPLVRWLGSDFEPSAEAPATSRELVGAVDGRPATFVAIGAPMAEARPTLVGRWEGASSYPVAAIGFVPRPVGANAPSPAWIRVQLDARSLVVRVPADVREGTRLYARFPEPVTARCVSLEIGPPSSGHVSALGDVTFFASFDLEGGLARVVDDLATGGETGALAADVLSRAGEAGARLLATRLADMPATERRLVLRVVTRLAERSEAAREVIAHALGDSDETVQRMAMEATRSLGDAGIALLEARIREGGLDVASELVRRAPARALDALLMRLTIASETERATLRDLIVSAGRRATPAEIVAAFGAERSLSDGARADLGLAAAELRGAEDVARTIAASLDVPGAEFPVRYKILRIAHALPAEARGDALIAFAVRSLEAEEWMSRAEAIRIAGDPSVPNANALRARLLEDRVPRVRVAAIEAGPLDDTLVVAVARLARLDDWPIVRAAGVTAIASDARTRPIQRAAVRDRAERVRIAAIDVLIANADVGGYEQIEGRLAASAERPDVYRAALRYVRRLCVRQAVPAVADLLDRMAADETTIEIAQDAALVLVALGTEDAREALGRAPGNIRGPLDAPNATRPALCVPVEAP